MHIIVVGCGRVGSGLAVMLEEAGHTVAVVDKRADAFRRLAPGFGGKTIQGFGFDRGTLESAGIEEAGGFVAVTNGDNSNILAARIARETFGIERVIARIYDPRRAEIYQRLGIPTVATAAWTIDQVLRRLLPNEVGHDWIDPTGDVALVSRSLPVEWAGRKLSELNEPGKFWLTAVTRYGSAEVAGTNLVGQEDDVVHLVVAVSAVDDLNARLAMPGNA